MIKKLILISFIAIEVVQGSSNYGSLSDPVVIKNENTKHAVWNTSIKKKASGESCKDGNCMSKDGKIYKFFTSVRDKVKKECKRL